ncbi:MAG: biopolymer transporter ExbD, partial [Rhodovibrionaceae bacterium]
EEERILPLINVVFLLLIFFMLAGRLAATDPFQVAPPSSGSEGRVAERELLILLAPDGRLALDGEVMEREALRAAVAIRMTAESAPRVQLKADNQVAADAVLSVMELLRESGVERLTLLTVPATSSGEER